jgi:hypothetical protein
MSRDKRGVVNPVVVGSRSSRPSQFPFRAEARAASPFAPHAVRPASPFALIAGKGVRGVVEPLSRLVAASPQTASESLICASVVALLGNAAAMTLSSGR